MKLSIVIIVLLVLIGCKDESCTSQITQYEAKIETLKEVVIKRDSIIAYQHQEILKIKNQQ